MRYTKNGWPDIGPKEKKPFHTLCTELTFACDIKLDHNIQELVIICILCQESKDASAVVQLHLWIWPRKRQMLHIDLVSLFCGKMFLILVDAHLK